MAFSEAIGLLFRISAENKASGELNQVGKDIEKLSKKGQSDFASFSKAVDKESLAIKSATSDALKGFAQNLGLTAEQTAKLGVALPLIGTGVTAIASAAVGAGVALFALAKSASDYGSTIKDFQDKTGLAAVTISTLKFNAEQSGIAFGTLSTPIAKFTKLLYEASKGSEKAQETLKKFGVTDFTDIDAGLSKVLAKIHGAANETEKTGLAMEVFGAKTGAVMRAVADNVDGDLGKAIETAKRLGVTLSEEDVKAADEFGDTLHTLSLQAQGISFQFAKEFMPQITTAMGDVSRYFAQNKQIVTEWGESVSNVIKGVRAALESDIGRMILKISELSIKYSAMGLLFSTLEKYGASQPKFEVLEDGRQLGGEGRGGKPKPSPLDSDMFGAGGGGGSGKAPKAAKAKKDVTDSFDKQFRELAKEYDFAVSRTKGGKINSGSLHPAGLAGDLGVRGKSNEEALNVIAAGIQKGWRVIDERVVGAFAGIKSTGPNIHMEKGAGVKPSLFLDASRYGGAENLAYLKKIDEDRRNKRSSVDEITKFKDDIKKKDDDIKKKKDAEEEAYQRKKDHFKEEAKLAEEVDQKADEGALKMWEMTQARLEAEKKATTEVVALRLKATESEQNLTDFRKEQKRKVLDIAVDLSVGRKKLDALVVLREFDLKESDRKHAREIENLDSEQKKALEDLEERATKDVALAARVAEEKTAIEDYYKNLKLQSDEANEANKSAVNKGSKQPINQATKDAQGGIWGTIAEGIGGIAGAVPDIGGKITTQAETIKAVYADLKGVAADAIGSMVSGLANLVQQWVLTGKFSAKAALAMAAGIAVGIAIQSGIKALFEVAEGMAAAANPFTAWMAPMHFAAAKMYGTVAAYAGIAGAGLAAAGRMAGGGNSASSAFKQQTSGGNYDFRKTDAAKDSGPRTYEEDRFRRQEVTHQVNIKLDRGMIGQHVVEDFKNAGPVRGLLLNLIEG
jgi:hypothetical protein